MPYVPCGEHISGDSSSPKGQSGMPSHISERSKQIDEYPSSQEKMICVRLGQPKRRKSIIIIIN